MHIGRLLAAGIIGGASKVGAQLADVPVLGHIDSAWACGGGLAPTSPNPDAMHNSNTPADYYGSVQLDYNDCDRSALAKYQGFVCTQDSGCGWAELHKSNGNHWRCDSPVGQSGCHTAWYSDANVIATAQAWFDSDLSTPYEGKTGWY